MSIEKEFYIESMIDLIEIATETEEEPVVLYSEQKVTAPDWMKSAVKRGKKIRDSLPPSQRCCTDVGLRRANQIENGETLSLSTLKRMKSFAARHSGGTDFRSLDPKSKKAQSLRLWGISPSKSGVKRFMKWVDGKIEKLEK